jgi:hypothetical protein
LRGQGNTLASFFSGDALARPANGRDAIFQASTAPASGRIVGTRRITPHGSELPRTQSNLPVVERSIQERFRAFRL